MIFIRRVQVKDIDCPVEVTVKKSNKHIYLRVRSRTLFITAPHDLSDEFIRELVLKNYTAIAKALSTPPPVENKLHFFGREYELRVCPSERERVIAEDGILWVFTKKKENSHIQKTVLLFYAKELSNFVEKNISAIKSAFHFNEEIQFQYKNVKSYFGECFPKRRIIILSLKLAKYDPYYILSVLYHEMAHFFHQNHGMRFYALLEQVFPGYRRVQKELRKIKYNDIF